MLEQLERWSPRQLELAVEELFNRNGYTTIRRNDFDREGGDIDLAFGCFPDTGFIADVFSAADGSVPELRVQVKKKSGRDSNDIEGVEQLTRMRDGRSSFNIVINTAEGFSDRAKEAALKEGILLISGLAFADLLVRYGLINSKQTYGGEEHA